MHLRSGKTLEMVTKSTNSGASASSQSSSQAQTTHASAPLVGASVLTIVEATMVKPDLTEMRVTASTTAPTVIATMTPPKMGTFVPPFRSVQPCLLVFLHLFILKLDLDLMIG